MLLTRLDNAGDVLLSGPAARAAARGASRLSYLCAPPGEAAARLLPGVDEVVVTPAPWVAFDPPPIDRRGIESLLDRLSAMEIDQAAILTSFHQSPLPLALLLRMAGIGSTAAVSVDYPGSLLDRRLVVDDDQHEVLRDLQVVAALGHRLGPGDDGRLRVSIPASVAAPPPIRPLLGADGSRYVVVHPGASVPARAWPSEHMRDLVSTLACAGTVVVVTGGQREMELTSWVAGAAAIDLGGATTLAELALVLANADALVVGNTGPAHLAAAVGTPVVSIYAPTVPSVRFEPWGVEHLTLGNQDIACAGCRARVCSEAGHPCISEVTVSQVIAALESLRPPERPGSPQCHHGPRRWHPEKRGAKSG